MVSKPWGKKQERSHSEYFLQVESDLYRVRGIQIASKRTLHWNLAVNPCWIFVADDLVVILTAHSGEMFVFWYVQADGWHVVWRIHDFVDQCFCISYFSHSSWWFMRSIFVAWQMQDIATENFQRIREAYEILSDERKRQVYDLYGMEGLTSGLELGPKLKTRDEVRQEFERLQHRQVERKLASHVHHRGSMLLNLSFAQMLDTYDTGPRLHGYGSFIFLALLRSSVVSPLSSATFSASGAKCLY